MIPDSHAYTISFANNHATLDIASTPKDVVLSVDGDALDGPAAMAVDGRIALGSVAGASTCRDNRWTSTTPSARDAQLRQARSHQEQQSRRGRRGKESSHEHV